MSESVRIDKWLWAARFFKTRALACDALEHGKVRLQGARVKPARALRCGDELQIDNGAATWDVRVLGLSDQRGGAPIARTLYAESADSMARREKQAQQNILFGEPGAAIKGRPTKRDRRQLSKANGER